MWPISDRFKETLYHNHRRTAKIEVLVDGEVALEVQGEPVDDPITGKEVLSTGGHVDVSRSNIRRSGSGIFANAAGIFSTSDIRDLFVPLRNEIRIWSGVQYWDGGVDDVEYVPVATLVISKVDASNWPAVEVTGYDRMWIIQRSTLTEIRWYTFEPTFTVIEDLFREALPPSKSSFNFPFVPDVVPYSTWDEQYDRAEAGQQIALSAGQVLYVDPMGTFTATSMPEAVSENIVAEYRPGVDSTMFRPKRTVSGENTFNVVIAKGESPDGVAVASKGVWMDENPLSLTYVGAVGKLPYYYASPLLDTNDKAFAAAQTIGQRESGLTDSIVVPAIANPALESGDIIYVEDPEQEISAILIADEFPVPIRAVDGLQEIECRTQVFQ